MVGCRSIIAPRARCPRQLHAEHFRRASMQGLSRSSSCSGSIFFQEPMEQLSSFCASAEARSAGAARTDARRKNGA